MSLTLIQQVFQLCWDRVTLLVLPKADETHGGENGGKERWSSRHLGEINLGLFTKDPLSIHWTIRSLWHVKSKQWQYSGMVTSLIQKLKAQRHYQDFKPPQAPSNQKQALKFVKGRE